MNYLICTSQRSGKTWLCKILRALDLGIPEEYVNHFRPDSADPYGLRTAWQQGGSAGFIAQLQTSTGSSTDGATGLVLQYNQLTSVANRDGYTPKELFENIRSDFGDHRVYFLKRHDTLAQAVSLYLKNDSGYTNSQSDPSLKSKRENLGYNRDRMLWAYEHTMRSYHGWENLFKDSGLEPLRISYEDMNEDIVQVVTQMAKELGRAATRERIVKASAALKKIADSTDKNIREAALADPEFVRRSKEIARG